MAQLIGNLWSQHLLSIRYNSLKKRCLGAHSTWLHGLVTVTGEVTYVELGEVRVVEIQGLRQGQHSGRLIVALGQDEVSTQGAVGEEVGPLDGRHKAHAAAAPGEQPHGQQSPSLHCTGRGVVGVLLGAQWEAGSRGSGHGLRKRRRARRLLPSVGPRVLTRRGWWEEPRPAPIGRGAAVIGSCAAARAYIWLWLGAGGAGGGFNPRSICLTAMTERNCG